MSITNPFPNIHIHQFNSLWLCYSLCALAECRFTVNFLSIVFSVSSLCWFFNFHSYSDHSVVHFDWCRLSTNAKHSWRRTKFRILPFSVIGIMQNAFGTTRKIIFVISFCFNRIFSRFHFSVTFSVMALLTKCFFPRNLWRISSRKSICENTNTTGND